METPNTRSRRKRETEGSSQEEPMVSWMHDQGLRWAVLQATKDETITPPTPTQKPRPISSRFSPSSHTAGLASSSTSTRPPRKRPCRAHRSLPLPIRRPGSADSPGESMRGNSLPNTLYMPGHPSTGSTSNPASSSGDGCKTRLEALLEKVALLDSPPETSRAGSITRRSIPNGARAGGDTSAETPSRGLRPRGAKMIVDNHSVSGSTVVQSTPTRSRRKLGNRQLGENESQPMFGATSDKIGSTNKTDIQVQSREPRPARNPLSPVKPGVPRIGLGSQHRNGKTAASNRSIGNPGHSFRTPFLAGPQAVRSSPRRTTEQPVRTVRPIPPLNPDPGASRAVVAAAQKTKPSVPGSKSGTRSPTGKRPSPASRSSSASIASSTPSLAPTHISDHAYPPRHRAGDVGLFDNYDIGGNEPHDSSFDSFDGIFAEGGEELEMLLRQVDGAR
ncbi:hypothetical protein IAU60_004052 [Kwoniella sp. DSM 27419]